MLLGDLQNSHSVADRVFSAQAFWDYSEKKLVGKTKAECSVTSEWSPDGRHFMTATTAPRLQIDNGYIFCSLWSINENGQHHCDLYLSYYRIKIFDHNGSLQFKKMFEKLYQVSPGTCSPQCDQFVVDVHAMLVLHANS